MSLLASGMRRMRKAGSRQWSENANSCKSLPSLIDAVRQQDAVLEHPRGGNGMIHVSALVGTGCARKLSLEIDAAMKGEAPPEQVSGDMRVVWAMGRAAEKHAREAWIKTYGIASFGKWSCKCGATKREGFNAPSLPCSKCGTHPDNYEEIDLMDDVRGITGHPDFLYECGDGLRVVEIKSIKAQYFDALTEAKPEHIAQLLHYIRMARETLTENVSTMGTVFYVRKDFAFKGIPYKSFDIDSTLPLHEMRIDSDLARASAVREYLNGGGIPKRLGQCKTPATPTAKKCSACVACFQKL